MMSDTAFILCQLGQYVLPTQFVGLVFRVVLWVKQCMRRQVYLTSKRELTPPSVTELQESGGQILPPTGDVRVDAWKLQRHQHSNVVFPLATLGRWKSILVQEETKQFKSFCPKMSHRASWYDCQPHTFLSKGEGNKPWVTACQMQTLVYTVKTLRSKCRSHRAIVCLALQLR